MTERVVVPSLSPRESASPGEPAPSPSANGRDSIPPPRVEVALARTASRPPKELRAPVAGDAAGDSSRPPPPDAQESPSSRPPPREPRTDRGARFVEHATGALDAIGTARPAPLAPDRQQRIDTLVAELAASAPDAEGPVRRRVLALGREALPALVRVFPGSLWVDLSRPHRPLRSGRTVSAVASTLIAFGDDAVPHVVTLMRSSRPEVRLAACLVAADLVRGELVRPLAARLRDDVRPVRHAAVVALRAGAMLSEARGFYGELVRGLEDDESPIHWRVEVAWTLGQLREPEAVPRLIEQLSQPSPLSEAVRGALVRIVGHDHARFRFGWRRWWAQHGNEDRVSWLADALARTGATRRARVLEELVLLTGESFERHGATETREQARAMAERYLAWSRRQR